MAMCIRDYPFVREDRYLLWWEKSKDIIQLHKNNILKLTKLELFYIYIHGYLGLNNRCVSANMPKKIRVGRSENLFIFLQIFI